MESAKSMDFVNIPSVDEVKDAVFSTLEANGMKNDTHIRLTLTRGE
ncbi:MAG TPA: aminotransferase IV, partial [Flavobacteriales bacterium]|nr:aminotransferase IV [Flavobacteriales bacterium]